VRWGVTPNLTLNATVNPDFSQVEADAGQFQFDPRQALFFPEKRPFVLDGLGRTASSAETRGSCRASSTACRSRVRRAGP
jgi:hypothetical protein